jgi:hypothetical protein
MFSFFRGFGQTLGVAIGGNIFQRYSQTVSKLPYACHILMPPPSRLVVNLKRHANLADRADALAADATALVHWMKTAPPSPERDAMRESYTRTLQSLYIMATVVAAVALFASFWVQHYDLNQALETEHGLEGADDVSLDGIKADMKRVEAGRKRSQKREKY